MIDGVVLGFDFGTRRIGVAIGSRLTGRARPLTTIDTGDSEVRWESLGALIDEWQPVALAVGIPRHPDDTPHAMTTRCERFARQLEGRYHLPVARIDEPIAPRSLSTRLTSMPPHHTRVNEQHAIFKMRQRLAAHPRKQLFAIGGVEHVL